jgi:hypothetical protein
MWESRWRDVEAPEDRPLDLGAQLAPDLVEVGVVPDLRDGAGEAAVAVEQRRRLGDRPPAVQVPLGVEGEVHADVLAPVPAAASRAHGHGTINVATWRNPRAAPRRPLVGRVAHAEVVAVDDQQAVVGTVRRAWSRGRTLPAHPTGPAGAGASGSRGTPGPPHCPQARGRRRGRAGPRHRGRAGGPGWGDRRWPPLPPLDQREVHEQSVGGPVDVGEEAPVPVAGSTSRSRRTVVPGGTSSVATAVASAP